VFTSADKMAMLSRSLEKDGSGAKMPTDS